MKNYSKIGLQNEEDIINYLNKKTFESLNGKWQKHILKMFPFINDTDVIYASKFPNHLAKPDIIVKTRHSIQYVSIKSGKNPSVHQEEVRSFYRFLQSLDISERTRYIMRFYHYGETDKINNHGIPFTREELISKYSSYFLQANIELDKDKIIEQIIDRTVIRGADRSRTAVTYFYYGSLQKGFLLSKEEVYSTILSYREHEGRPIHFGALNYQPAGRNRNAIDHHYVRIKWPMLAVLFYKNEDDK